MIFIIYGSLTFFPTKVKNAFQFESSRFILQFQVEAGLAMLCYIHFNTYANNSFIRVLFRAVFDSFVNEF